MELVEKVFVPGKPVLALVFGKKSAFVFGNPLLGKKTVFVFGRPVFVFGWPVFGNPVGNPVFVLGDPVFVFGNPEFVLGKTVFVLVFVVGNPVGNWLGCSMVNGLPLM